MHSGSAPHLWSTYRQRWLLLLALSSAACSGLDDRHVWSPSPPCATCYQGEGEGPSYAVALAKARQSLCENLAVVIRSEATDTSQHNRRLAIDGSEGFNEAFHQEIVRMVSTTQANCVFENMPIVEMRQDAGDATFVMLKVTFADYEAYLRTRTVSIRISTDGSAGQTGSALASLTEHLLRQGYLVVEGTEGAKHEGRLNVTFQVREPSQELVGLIVGTGQLDWSLVRLADGVEVERAHIPGLVGRGFSVESVLRNLDAAVAEALHEYWRLK